MYRQISASVALAGSLFSIPFSALASTYSDDGSEPMGPIVVTATRTVSTEKKVASSVTVIDREEIDNSGKDRVVELLRTVPGLTVIQSGGAGQVSSVFMRGTNSNHVLVLIDGIEISDPSNPTGQVDFSNLVLDNIERIEVVRGPQSTLYGSDAIGGVIHIITRNDASMNYHLEIGERATVNTGAALRQASGIHRFGISANVLDTAGTSAANPDTTRDEKDAYRNLTASIDWTTAISDSLSLGLQTRLQKAEAEIDQGFPVAHDPDATGDTDQIFSRLSLDWTAPGGLWSQRVSYSHSQHERQNENGPAGANPVPSESTFHGNKSKLDWQHNQQVNAINLVTIGAEVEHDRMRSANLAESARTSAVYLQDQLSFSESLGGSVGIRHDNHDQFGGENTWRVTPLIKLNDAGLQFKASYGTGFKAPTLSQLYDNTFGTANPDLQPESSKGWDAGISQQFALMRLEIIYFRNEIDELIDFDLTTFTLSNISRARTSGYEVMADYQFLQNLEIGTAYTRTRATNVSTGAKLLRRPENEFAINMNWQVMHQLRLGLGARHIGRRDDFIGFAPGNLPSYRVVDMNAGYDLTPNWTLTMRVDNLADKDYEETSGYGSPGRAGYLGVRWQSQ